MRLTIGKKLRLGFGALIVLMGVSATVAQLKISEVVNSAQPTAEACEDLMNAIFRSSDSLRRYVILGGDRQAFREGHNAVWTEIDAARDALEQRRSELSTADLANLNIITGELEGLKQAQQDVESLAHTDENIPAYKILLEEARPKVVSMLQSLTTIIDEEGTLEATPQRKEFLNAMADSRGSLANGLARIRAYLLTGDSTIHAEFQQHWDVNQQAFDLAHTMTDLMTPAQADQWKNYSRLRAEFAPLPNQMLRMRDNPAWNRANYMLETELGASEAKIADALGKLKTSATGRLQASSRALTTTLLSATAVAILVGLAVALVLSRQIVTPVQALVASAQSVAAGDLTGEAIRVRSNDEIGELGQAFNTMTESLRKTMSELASKEDLLAAEAERNRLFEEVREQEKRTAAILDSTADGLITINSQGIIQSVNAAALSLLDYSEEELIGQNVSMLAPSPHREEHDHYLERYLRTGQARILNTERELAAVRKDGSTFPIALRVTELEYAGDKVFIGTIQDITNRKQSEDERNKLFDGIREAVSQLATSSTEILTGTTQQATSAQEQAATVSETAATMDEIAQTANQSTERAKEVAESARKADEVAHSGRKAVGETIAAMRSVREQVEATADNILALAERAQAIGEIITSVNEIADQTNLLAVNAAIEASRAGDYGKGFAVVAVEIKALAEQSKKATDQVRQILGEIQQATNTAVVSTEQGTRSVSEATAVFSKAEETIDMLGNTIGEAARAAAQIVAAAGQQAAGMNQISQSMSHIDEATKQTLSATRQAKESAQALNDLGNRLKDLIEGNGRPAGQTSIAQHVSQTE